MRLFNSLIAVMAIGATAATAQEFKETVHPLSGKATKGYMYEVTKEEGGNTYITYKMKGDKKSDDISYEKYSFDKDLKFINAADVQEKKEQKEDYQGTYYYANVGGGNSFDVMSMKLRLNKVVRLLTWNHEKQRYTVKKVISSENIKPKNDDGQVYYGYASYTASDPAVTDVFVLAKNEAKSKKEIDKFFVLQFDEKLELKKQPLDLNGAYSLVFCDQLKSEDVVMIFAPNKGAADVSKYIFYQYDIAGNLKHKIEFKSPASALLITAAYENAGNIYFFGTSPKSEDAYAEKFSEYAPISNPGFTEGGNNSMDFKWRKSLDEKMDNFHLLKFSGSQLAFASQTPISEFKSKYITAKDDKGASPYKGSKFFIENFTVTASEDYLVAGQLTSTVSMGIGNAVDSYEDIVCFHFDKTGNLKAQYGIGKMNTDKKSEIFYMTQRFFPSSDGKSMFWELMEVKGTKGYESFTDAYNGVPTFYPLYFPRLVKIDLEKTSLGAVSVMGGEKYFLRRDFTSKFDKTENSITYIGHDDDWKKLWIGKVRLD